AGFPSRVRTPAPAGLPCRRCSDTGCLCRVRRRPRCPASTWRGSPSRETAAAPPRRPARRAHAAASSSRSSPLLNCLERIPLAADYPPRIQRAHVRGALEKTFGERPPRGPALSLLPQQPTDVQVGQHPCEPLGRQQHVPQVVFLELTGTPHQLRRAAWSDLPAQVEHQPT